MPMMILTQTFHSTHELELLNVLELKQHNPKKICTRVLNSKIIHVRNSHQTAKIYLPSSYKTWTKDADSARIA